MQLEARAPSAATNTFQYARRSSSLFSPPSLSRLHRLKGVNDRMMYFICSSALRDTLCQTMACDAASRELFCVLARRWYVCVGKIHTSCLSFFVGFFHCCFFSISNTFSTCFARLQLLWKQSGTKQICVFLSNWSLGTESFRKLETLLLFLFYSYFTSTSLDSVNLCCCSLVYFTFK